MPDLRSWLPNRQQLFSDVLSNLATVAILAFLGVAAVVAVAVLRFLWSSGPSLGDLVLYLILFVAAVTLVSVRVSYSRMISQSTQEPPNAAVAKTQADLVTQDVPAWLLEVAESDKNSIATALYRISRGLNFAGLYREFDRYIIIGFHYVNLSVYTLAIDPPAKGRIQFKSQYLESNPEITKPTGDDAQNIRHLYSLNIDIKIPLSDSAANVMKAEIKAGQDIRLGLRELEVWFNVLQDKTIEPFRLRLDEEVYKSSEIVSNLFMNAVALKEFQPEESVHEDG